MTEPVYDRLLGARRQKEPPAATLVVLAAARIAGLSMDGKQKHEGHVATSTEIVIETGLDRATVAAAFDWIGENLSHVHIENGSRGARLVRVEAQEMVERWADKWQRVSYPRRLRDGSIDLRPTAALLVAWVCGQTGSAGFKTFFVFKSTIGKVLDLKPGAVKRAIAAADEAGALRRWVDRAKDAARPVDRLHLAVGDALRVVHDEPEVAATCGLPAPLDPGERPAGFRPPSPPDLLASGPPTCGLPAPSPVDIRTRDLRASGPQKHRLTPVSRQTTTTGGEIGAAAVPAGGGGDEPRTDQQQSQQPVTPAEPTTATAPTATPTPKDARAVLAELHDEDRRRELLTDPRVQEAKVQDLLGRVGFATTHPDRQQATAKSIAERHGADATRWLLDLLHGIAADPTTDVPAVLSTRIKNGLLAAAEQGTTSSNTSTNSRSPRPAPHAAGAGDRAANARRRAEEHAHDPDGRLREMVVARTFGDRASPEVVADELNVAVDRVSAIVAEERQRRDAEQQPAAKKGPRSFGSRQTEDGAGDPAAKRATWGAIVATYNATGRKVPSHILEAFKP